MSCEVVAVASIVMSFTVISLLKVRFAALIERLVDEFTVPLKVTLPVVSIPAVGISMFPVAVKLSAFTVPTVLKRPSVLLTTTSGY